MTSSSKHYWDTIQLADGHRLSLSIHKPQKTVKATIIVLQEIFGVTSFIQQVCQYWTERGYLAIAPALYDRLDKNIIVSYDGNGIDAALDHREKLAQVENSDGLRDWELQLYDIKSTLEYAQSIHSGPTAITGFCWGGTLCWLSAARLKNIACVSAYYGTHIYQFIDEAPTCPFMLHAGDLDEHLTLEHVNQLKEKYPQIEVYQYPAGHAFRCPYWPAYDPESAYQADLRTEKFFSNYLT